MILCVKIKGKIKTKYNFKKDSLPFYTCSAWCSADIYLSYLSRRMSLYRVSSLVFMIYSCVCPPPHPAHTLRSFRARDHVLLSLQFCWQQGIFNEQLLGRCWIKLKSSKTFWKFGSLLFLAEQVASIHLSQRLSPVNHINQNPCPPCQRLLKSLEISF